MLLCGLLIIKDKAQTAFQTWIIVCILEHSNLSQIPATNCLQVFTNVKRLLCIGILPVTLLRYKDIEDQFK